MGDTKYTELGKGTLQTNEEEVVGVALPVGEGLRRSRRVRKLPPSNSEGGGGSSAAGETKRKRGRRQEADDPTEDKVAHDGDDVKVNNSVEVSPTAKASLEVEGGEEETGKRSLPLLPNQQQTGVAHHSKNKVGGGAVVKAGEEASLFTAMSTTAAMSESGDGSSQQSVEDDEAHPCLFIETVLEVIFSHIIDLPGSKQDVRSIRLVCKTWKDSATRLYRRSAPTLILQKYEPVNQNSTRKTLTQFMDTMKFSQLIPVQKFKLYGKVFAQENLKMFRDFLLICGPDAVSLNFSIQPGDVERIMMNIKDLPHLNMLKLHTVELRLNEDPFSDVERTDHPTRVPAVVNLVQLLLMAAKNLRELNLSCAPYYNSPRNEQIIIMEQLGPIIATGIPRTVKHLKLLMEINETTFNNLANVVGLELETFEFGVQTTLARMALYEFLQSQAATLKEFKLWNKLDKGGFLVEFPPLHELVSLELGDAIISITAHSEFAKTFPKLHTLGITRMSTEVAFQALLSDARAPAPSLKCLHLPSWRWHPKSLAPYIKDVARSFPCIVDLHISLYDNTRETLLEIFKYFDKLESLRILFGEHFSGVDALFSGISENDCSRISRLQDFWNVNLEYQRQPSLLNLTKLRKLYVEDVGERTDWITFTDVSAHFVFLEMPNLREIRLPVSTMRFSPRYVDLLRGRRFTRE